ncbi:MAG TPA: signal peptidase I [Pseudonocardiaceae bacterium]|nr:signal peptidase I [Pseudonocardiaceae bacterium]
MVSREPVRGDEPAGSRAPRWPQLQSQTQLQSRNGPRHRHRRPEKKGSFWRELPILILTALVLTFLIQTFLARVYVIPSASMEPTLHGCTGCTNDRVLVDKVTYRFSDPQPGDVIVFRGPQSWGANTEFTNPRSHNVLVRGLLPAASLIGLAPPDERDFVKRVIAVGGQTVQCCDPQNRVLVDGKSLNESYAMFAGQEPQEEFGPIIVPEGGLWMMGDNRNNSADSRRHVGDEWSGTVPLDHVIGKARLIVLPPARWRSIATPDPQQVVAHQPVARGRG